MAEKNEMVGGNAIEGVFNSTVNSSKPNSEISAKSQSSTNLSKSNWLYPRFQQDCHSTHIYTMDS